MIRRRLLAFATAFGTGLVVAGPAVSETTVRFAHMNSPAHFVNTAGETMAKAIAERTEGAVKIDMYPSGQLGETSQITEQITLGGALMTQAGVGALANYVPDYSIVVYPFIYPDYEAAKRFLKSDLVKELETKAEKNDIKVLCYLHFGVRDLYTRNREAKTPAEAAGLKIRVQPATLYTEMVKSVMGGAPTPMPWPEVYSALSQGVIDAAEAPPSAIIDQKHYEAAKYLIQTNHILDISPLVMSATTFKAISPGHQAIVVEEAGKACDAMSEASIASYEKGIADLKAKGMSIVPADKQAFAARAGEIAKAFPEWTPGLYERARAIIANGQ